VPNGAGAVAVLGPVITTARTVTLDQAVTLGQLTISPTGTAAYTISGNATNYLTMTNTTGVAANITATAGQNTIIGGLSYTDSLLVTVGTGAVAGSSTAKLSISGSTSTVTGTGSLTKDGLGWLALGGSLSLSNSGSLLVNAGSMTTALSIVGTGSTVTVGVDVTHTATLKARTVHAHSLVLNAGSKVVLGVSVAAAGSSAADQTLLDTGLAVTPASATDSSLGGGSAGTPASTPVGIVDVAASVPEPSTWALAGVGVVALIGYTWRKRRSAVVAKTADLSYCRLPLD